MANKQINYFVAFLVLVFYLLATVGGNSSDSGSAAAARNPETGCWPQDVFLPLAMSDYINYFPGTQEVEPNNSYQEANGPLVSGIVYSGLFNDERDYFSVYVQMPGQINIILNTNETQNVQLQLFYQSINNRVGYDPSAPYQITYNGQPGWYYIFIYSGTSYPTPPTYNLIVTYPVPPTSTPHNPEPTPTCYPTSTATMTLSPTNTGTFTPTPTMTNTPTITPTATQPPGWYEVGVGSASGGGISNNSGSSGRASIAIASNNTIYVAWADDTSGNSEIYIRQWNGSSWVEVGTGSATGGGISNSSGSSSSVSIAIAPDNTPYVAWTESVAANAEIYVRRWNGSIWAEIGIGSASGGGISNNSSYSNNSSIAIAPDNTPYIAWYDDGDFFDYEIYIRSWNGSNWVTVGAGSASGGGISNNSTDSMYPSLAIAPNNMPYVAWSDGDSGYGEIYIRRWNGSSWFEVGAGSASGGGISNSPDANKMPTLAIALDNTPYVAWEHYEFPIINKEIYLRRWNGSGWVEVGAGSGSGGGISNNAGVSDRPSLAIGSSNIPIITWHDDSSSSGVPEIYVRQWNGTSWVEVGLGSASSGGISNNSGRSYIPSIAIAPNTIPYIVWYDNSNGNYEIYIRRWLE